MPTGLKRYQTQGHDHLITFSCYRRLPYLNDAHAKATFEHILEETRAKYRFEIHAYVAMPEYVHLLVSEPGPPRPTWLSHTPADQGGTMPMTRP